MKKQIIEIKASVGRGGVSLSAVDKPEDRVEDAKEICAFLLSAIPAGTFNEVEKFFQNFRGTSYPISNSPAFNKYFESRRRFGSAEKGELE